MIILICAFDCVAKINKTVLIYFSLQYIQMTLATPGGFSPKRNYSGITMLPASQITKSTKLTNRYNLLAGNTTRLKSNVQQVSCVNRKRERRSAANPAVNSFCTLWSSRLDERQTKSGRQQTNLYKVISNSPSPPPQKTNTAILEILLYI